MASIFLKPGLKSIPNPLAGTQALQAPKKKKIWQKTSDALEHQYKRLEEFYRRVLEFTLGYRKTVLFSAFVIFVLSLALTTFIGKEFNPPEDQSVFMVRMEAPIDYSVEQVEKYLGNTEQMMQDLPGVKSVYYVQGYGGYANRALIMINLVPKSQRKHTQEELKKMARTKFTLLLLTQCSQIQRFNELLSVRSLSR